MYKQDRNGIPLAILVSISATILYCLGAVWALNAQAFYGFTDITAMVYFIIAVIFVFLASIGWITGFSKLLWELAIN